MVQKAFLVSMSLLLFFSCSNFVSDSNSTDENSASYAKYNFGSYSEFGSDLDKAFRAVDSSRTAISSEDDADYYVLPEDQTGTGFLVESKYVSDLAAAYIQEIEEILDKDYSELEELLDEISKVELRALENLTGTDLDNVMYFAESTKTTFAYFSEIDDDSVDARGLKSWAKKKAKRIRRAAISAGIGSLFGGMTGFATGGIYGAIGGALSVGVASGIYGYQNNAISFKYSKRY